MHFAHQIVICCRLLFVLCHVLRYVLNHCPNASTWVDVGVGQPRQRNQWRVVVQVLVISNRTQPIIADIFRLPKLGSFLHGNREVKTAISIPARRVLTKTILRSTDVALDAIHDCRQMTKSAQLILWRQAQWWRFPKERALSGKVRIHCLHVYPPLLRKRLALQQILDSLWVEVERGPVKRRNLPSEPDFPPAFEVCGYILTEIDPLDRALEAGTYF